MGCGGSTQVKEKKNVIIEVAYCGSCGWAIPAKKVCDSIMKNLPNAVIDCRPEKQFTGVIRIQLIRNKDEMDKIYEGNKDSVNSNIEKITQDTVTAYNKA